MKALTGPLPLELGGRRVNLGHAVVRAAGSIGMCLGAATKYLRNSAPLDGAHHVEGRGGERARALLGAHPDTEAFAIALR